MTDLELARQARARADAATLGPWSEAEGSDVLAGVPCDLEMCKRSLRDHYVFRDIVSKAEDRAFIAAARTDVPLLCDAVERLVAEVERLMRERDDEKRTAAAFVAIAHVQSCSQCCQNYGRNLCDHGKKLMEEARPGSTK